MTRTALKDIDSELDRFRGRVLAAAAFVVFCFVLLAARLVWLQVLAVWPLLAASVAVVPVARCAQRPRWMMQTAHPALAAR